jgi:hypothetical protein
VKRNARHRYYSAAAALILPAAIFAAWVWWPWPEIDMYALPATDGYYALTPPSTLFLPGSFGTIEKQSDQTVVLGLACDMDQKQLKDMTSQSDTADTSVTSKISDRYVATARAAIAALSESKGQRVREISASLENTRILAMSEQSLIAVQNEYLKGDCQQAVRALVDAGRKVCQTQEVLLGDISYRMSFQKQASIEQRTSFARELAVKLGFDGDRAGEDSIKGKGLHYGVKFGLFCILPNEKLEAHLNRPASG